MGATPRKVPQKHTAREGKGEKVVQETTRGRVTGLLGKPHPQQDQIGGG